MNVKISLLKSNAFMTWIGVALFYALLLRGRMWCDFDFVLGGFGWMVHGTFRLRSFSMYKSFYKKM